MVMDANQPQPPSPQSVGREFVRQYYTLLNKAPHHLHRFYNSQSSFIHGESTLVVGQKNIFSRIQQLNFHDCHAKISQVDAQATLGNGVVVQVTGELSNDGQPMRRFTQTFVLAAQSPKKYYVHNDIFRYQDLYAEEDNDVESRSEHDEESEQATVLCEVQGSNLVAPPAETLPLMTTQVLPNATNSAVITQQQTVNAPPQQQAIYYSMPAGGPTARPLPVMNQAPTAAQVQPQYSGNAVPLQAGGINQLNGLVAHEDIIGGNGLQQQAPPQQQQQPQQSLAQVPVLTAQNATLPVANAAAMPQTANQLSGFQQTPLLPPPQQQHQPQHHQQPQAHPQTQQPQQASIIAQPQPPIQQQQPQQTPTPTQPQQPPQPQQQPPQPQQPPQQQLQPQPQQQPSLPPPPQQQQQVAPHMSIVNAVEEEKNYPIENTVQPSVVSVPLVVDDFKTINEQQQQEKYVAAKQQQNEPKTYANLFKSSSTTSSCFVNAMQQQQQQIQQQQQQQIQQQQQHQHQQQQQNLQNSNNSTSFQSQQNNNNNNNSISSSTYSQSNNSSSNNNNNNNNGNSNNNSYNNRNNENSLHRMDNNNVGGGQGPLPQRNSRMNKDFDQRRLSNNTQFGDNQQLFLGNIPHHATEDELKKLFAQFGTVLELRILSKPTGKMLLGSRNPLNYGFITYNDTEAVQNCLSHCPLYFPDNSPEGQKLNVEEKKPRMRNDMQSKPFMNNNMNNNPRNMSGAPQSRSLSGGTGGSSGVMRSNNSGNMSRGGNSSRIGSVFGRNDSRSGTTNGGGSQLRGNNNNAQSGGGNYGNRR